MTTFLTCCSRDGYSPAASKKSALLMLGSSFGLVLIYLGWTKLAGDSPWSQALLYAAFNIAILIAGLPTFLANYRKLVRWALLVLGIGASYGFFLALTFVTENS